MMGTSAPRRRRYPVTFLTCSGLSWAVPVEAVELPSLFFDPVEKLEQIIVLSVFFLFVAIGCKFKDKVIYVFTGDSRVHADQFDLLWFVGCRCFGTCDGEWTRYLSACLCICSDQLRGRNLKRVLGQQFGFCTIACNINNITVGDLPTKSTLGDFFVSIEVGEYPAQVTAVSQESNPKVVQFSSTFLLALRNSVIDNHVRFAVKELRTFGHKDLCECYIHPTALLEWSDENRGPMRFRMDACERTGSSSLRLPPWILLEVAKAKETGWTNSFNVTIEDSSGANTLYQDAASFKTAYQLVDTQGAKAFEPNESGVGKIAALTRMKERNVKHCCFHWILFCCFVTLFRAYCLRCSQSFEQMEVLHRHGLDTSSSAHLVDEVLSECHFKEITLVSGFGEDFGAFASWIVGSQVAGHIRRGAHHMGLHRVYNRSMAKHVLTQAGSVASTVHRGVATRVRDTTAGLSLESAYNHTRDVANSVRRGGRAQAQAKLAGLSTQTHAKLADAYNHTRNLSRDVLGNVQLGTILQSASGAVGRGLVGADPGGWPGHASVASIPADGLVGMQRSVGMSQRDVSKTENSSLASVPRIGDSCHLSDATVFEVCNSLPSESLRPSFGVVPCECQTIKLGRVYKSILLLIAMFWLVSIAFLRCYLESSIRWERKKVLADVGTDSPPSWVNEQACLNYSPCCARDIVFAKDQPGGQAEQV